MTFLKEMISTVNLFFSPAIFVLWLLEMIVQGNS